MQQLCAFGCALKRVSARHIDRLNRTCCVDHTRKIFDLDERFSGVENKKPAAFYENDPTYLHKSEVG